MSSTTDRDQSTDESLFQQLVAADFDPVSFLNDSLPSISLPPALSPDKVRSRDLSLQNLSNGTQSFLTEINAQNIRSSSALSQLTDEILRSGSRLAYEVEVLREDTNALNESLGDLLKEDIQKLTGATPGGANEDSTTIDDYGTSEQHIQSNVLTNGYEPDFIGQLRMLGQVKEKLEAVISVFGEAMKWPPPPSENSIASSLISVSAPGPGEEGIQTRSEKGKEFAKKTQAEILDLLSDDTGGGPDVEAATAKVEALRILSGVWKGTVEERPRGKFVEGLRKLVDEKRSQIEGIAATRLRSQQPPRGHDTASARGNQSAAGDRTESDTANTSGPGGLFRNLQRLRGEIYLD
jgi:hypothetical protein